MLRIWVALHQVMRTNAESLGFDERDAMPRQQIVQDLGVLPGDRRAQDGQHAGGQAQIDG